MFFKRSNGTINVEDNKRRKAINYDIYLLCAVR